MHMDIVIYEPQRQTLKRHDQRWPIRLKVGRASRAELYDYC
jgi:hypothetical protein